MIGWKKRPEMVPEVVWCVVGVVVRRGSTVEGLHARGWTGGESHNHLNTLGLCGLCYSD